MVSLPAFSFLSIFLSFFFLHSHLHPANGGWRCLCSTKLSLFVASLRPLNGSLCCPLIKHLQTVISAACMHARTVAFTAQGAWPRGVTDDVSAEPPKTLKQNDTQVGEQTSLSLAQTGGLLLSLQLDLFLLR